LKSAAGAAQQVRMQQPETGNAGMQILLGFVEKNNNRLSRRELEESHLASAA
jgi:hypothetical protein